MDFLARSLGLDINAIAVQLAIDDQVQILPAQKLEFVKINEVPTIFPFAEPVYQNNTPVGPLTADEVRKGILVKGKQK